MEQYLRMAQQAQQENSKEETYPTASKSNFKYTSPQKRKVEEILPLYLLITDYPEQLYSNIVKEFSRFGEIKEIHSEQNSRWMIITYSKLESARTAEQSFNPYIIDPYNKQNQINVSLLKEEDKKAFLNSVYEDRNLVDSNANNIFEDNRKPPVKRTYTPIPNNKDYLTLGEPKSNFRKFVEVFFNL